MTTFVSVIRDAHMARLHAKPEQKPSKQMYVSSFGFHPLKALGRFQYGMIDADHFNDKMKAKMESGKVLERTTYDSLNYAFPLVTRELPVWDNHWSGSIDFVLNHNYSGLVTLIENKATSPKGFDFKKSFPRSKDICQLWLYGELYKAQFNRSPEDIELRLYYDAWGDYAEFVIKFNGKLFEIHGDVNGKLVYREKYIRPDLLRREVEEYYDAALYEPLHHPSDLDPNSWDYAEESYNYLVKKYSDSQRSPSL